MELEFEIKGEFFLEVGEPKKVPGILKYFKNQFIELEIFGSLSGLVSEPYSISWIYGESLEGKKITLTNVSNIESKMGFSFDYSRWTSNFLFIGARFSSDSTPIAISSTFTNLTSWLQQKYFRHNRSSLGLSSIKILNIRDRIFKIPNIGEIKIYHGLSSNNRFSEISLNNKAYVKLTKENSNFEELLRELNWLNSFISFATFSKSDIEQGNIYYEEDNPKWLKFYVGKSLNNTRANQKDHFYLYRYVDVSKSLKKLIQAWYEKRFHLSISINLLLLNLNGSTEFSEANFMNIIHGLENFHRSVRKNTVISEQKHKNRVAEVLKTIPPKYKDFIQSRLINSNEPSLHKRLESLIEEFGLSSFNKVVNDRDQFIRDVKNSRNYYTHFSKKLEKKALKGEQLFYLTEKLKILLISSILKEIGFSTNEIDRIIKNNEHNVFASLTFEEF